MEPSVQTLLLETPDAHDAYPMHVTKNWLLMHSATFSESIKRVKTRALRGVKSIRTYFGTIGGNSILAQSEEIRTRDFSQVHFMVPATRTRIVATRVSRVLVPSSTAAAR
jgi:hypothetical protein